MEYRNLVLKIAGEVFWAAFSLIIEAISLSMVLYGLVAGDTGDLIFGAVFSVWNGYYLLRCLHRGATYIMHYRIEQFIGER